MNDNLEINDSKNDNKKDENNYTPYYYFGYLMIKFEYLFVCIKLNSTWKYISSFIFNLKLFLLLLINFFSRAQKIKFKTDYKHIFNDNKAEKFDIYIYLIILFSGNYFTAFILYFILTCLEKMSDNKNEEEKNKNREKNIIKIIILDNLCLIICSLLNIIGKITDNKKQNILYISIAISGNVNYLYYIFFSLKKKQYISYSAFFSISTIFLRIAELFGKFQSYIFQIISSAIGIILSFIYYIKIIRNKKFKEFFFGLFKININIKYNKNTILSVISTFVLLLLFISPFLSPNVFPKTNNNINDKNETTFIIGNKTYRKVYYYIYKYCFESSDSRTIYPYYMIEDSGNYSICVYGPKAKNGGRGGKICGEDFFNNNSKLYLDFGGQEAGGEGGKGCGFFSGGFGHNGAGYCKVENENFILVAGEEVEIQKVEIKEEMLNMMEMAGIMVEVLILKMGD